VRVASLIDIIGSKEWADRRRSLYGASWTSGAARARAGPDWQGSAA
jgi:hypothetical protein